MIPPARSLATAADLLERKAAEQRPGRVCCRVDDREDPLAIAVNFEPTPTLLARDRPLAKLRRLPGGQP